MLVNLKDVFQEINPKIFLLRQYFLNIDQYYKLYHRNAVVELSELSTPSSSSNNLGRQPGHDPDIEGEINPSFVDGHKDTPC